MPFLVMYIAGAPPFERTKMVPADPELVAAFLDADRIIGTAPAGESAGIAPGISYVLEQLMNKLSSQGTKYPHPRQRLELDRLVKEIAMLMVEAERLGEFGAQGSLEPMRKKWMELRPRFRPFIGSAMDRTPESEQ